MHTHFLIHYKQGEYTVIIINSDKKEIQAVRDNSSPPPTEPSWIYYYDYGSGATQVKIDFNLFYLKKIKQY